MNRKSRLLIGQCLVASALILAAGTWSSAMSLEAQAQTAVVAAEEEITFFDSVAFDKTLADELAKQPSAALVVPSGPFSPNQIPPRLERWLASVTKTGGSVRLKRDAAVATRGILSDVVDLSAKSKEESAMNAMYARAKDYDALLTFNGNDVTAVRFVKRQAPAQPSQP